MGAAPFTHHKTFIANFFDPLGVFGGRKGFLGLSGGKQDSNSSSSSSANVPQVDQTAIQAQEEDRLKRIGRASLITASNRGVLTTGETSSKSLFGVQ